MERGWADDHAQDEVVAGGAGVLGSLASAPLCPGRPLGKLTGEKVGYEGNVSSMIQQAKFT